MNRDPAKYQIITPRGTLKLIDATPEEIMADLMRAYDVIHHVEALLGPLNRLTDDFIMGRNNAVDAVIEKAEAE